MADWRVAGPDTLAAELPAGALKGLRKSIVVRELQEVAVVMKDGEVTHVHTEGKVKPLGFMEGLLSRVGLGPDVSVVLVDISPRTLEFWLVDPAVPPERTSGERLQIPALTKDGQLVSAQINVTVAVNPERVDLLLRQMQGRPLITSSDLAVIIKDELLAKVIGPALAQHTASELRGNYDLLRRLGDEVEIQMRSTLEGYGLKLDVGKFYINWGLTHSDAQEIERRRRAAEMDAERHQSELAAIRASTGRQGEVGARSAGDSGGVSGAVITIANRGIGGFWITAIVGLAIAGVVFAAVMLQKNNPAGTPAPSSETGSSGPELHSTPTRAGPPPQPTRTPTPAIDARQTPNAPVAVVATPTATRVAVPVPTPTSTQVPTLAPTPTAMVSPTPTPTPSPTATPPGPPKPSLVFEWGRGGGFNTIYFSNDKNGWIGGDGGLLLQTEDGGETWQLAYSGTWRDIVDIDFVGDSLGHAIANGRIDNYGHVSDDKSVVLQTTDGGTTWQRLDTLGGRGKAIGFADSERGIAVTEAVGGTRLWLTEDGGESWSRFSLLRCEGSSRGSKPVFTSATHGWLLNSRYRTDDSGETWQCTGVRAQYFLDVDTGWGSLDGDLVRTGDGGKTWEVVAEGLCSSREPLGFSCNAAIVFADESRGWAISRYQGRTIYRTVNGGVSWFAQPTPDMDQDFLVDIWVKDGNYFAITNQRLFASFDSGETWADQTSPPSQLWGGSLSGPSLAQIAPGEYPVWELAGGIDLIEGPGDRRRIAENVLQDKALGIFFANKQTGWVVGSKGQVARSNNGGQTWTRLDTPVAEDLRHAFFLDNQEGWVVGNNGVILYTADGGDTWEFQNSQTQDDIGVIDCAGTSLCAAATDQGSLLLTEDMGLHWHSYNVLATPRSDFYPALSGVSVLGAQEIWLSAKNQQLHGANSITLLVKVEVS